MKVVALGIAALTAIVALPCFAGSTTSYVTRVHVRQRDGIVYFDTAGPIANRALTAPELARAGLTAKTWTPSLYATDTGTRP